MVQSESPLTNYHLHQRRRDQVAVTGNWSQKAGSMETRHFMIAGCPGVGKTSLLLTVARGVFPPDESALPKRFEGWSITVSGPKEDAETAKGEKSKLQRPQLVVQRCHSLGSAPTTAASGSPRTPTSQSSSAARPAASATGGAAVNIVLWEDWPRKVEEKRDGSEEDSSESEESSSDEEDDDEGHHEDLETDFRKLEMERDPVTGRTTLTPRLNPKQHRVLHATRSNKSEASSEACFPPAPPPCQPERPCLSPRPSVIMLCFARGDVDTFVEAETVIFPELTERYPHVPVILCATKCDDENNGDEGGEESAAAAAAVVVPTSGNGDLAVINEEDSKSCQNAAAAASRKFGVSSEMGIAMAKRIGARAYIECSAKEMRGLSPILQEAYRCAVLEAGAAGASATNGHGGFGGFPSIIRKKNSAPSFLFNSSSSSLSAGGGGSGTSGVKKKSGKSMMGRKSAAAASSLLRRSKAASLHLINKSSNSDNK